jgi:hypothetical protein
MKLRAFSAGLALLASISLAACTDLVAGDSLVVQAATATSGAPTPFGVGVDTADGVTLKGYSGAAPCDYRKFIGGDYDKYMPSKVTLAFSGNNGSACMRSASGAPLTGIAYLWRYHDDLVALTNYLTAKKVKVIYSAPLCTSSTTTFINGSAALRSMEAGLAIRFRAQGVHILYSDYADLQICPNWQYVSSYRASDGLHLSNAGAVRYATALRYESKTVNP